MTSIFRAGMRFDRSSSGSLQEAEYEDLILGNSESLFPGFHLLPFKKEIDTNTGRRKPDLALIDKGYRRWWIVEVELANHPFRQHVLPQVEALAEGTYGTPESTYLVQQDAALIAPRLTSMILGNQPQVLVIVNEPCPSWESELRMRDILLVSISLFRSRQNDYLLVVDGRLPEMPPDLITKCRRSRILPKFWEVVDPGGLPEGLDDVLTIETLGRPMGWRRLSTRDKVYLIPQAPEPFDVTTRAINLVRTRDGQVAVRPAT